MTKKTAPAQGRTADLTLKEGDKAPLFNAIDQDGKPISLTDFRGKKVILFFYPEDDTPTCTIQACNLRDNYAMLKQAGFTVIGVSPDNKTKHKRFEKKFNLPYRLIPDTEHAIIDKYGVWGMKELFGREYMGLFRTTFVIDDMGLIKRIFTRPSNKRHAEEIIESLSA